MTKSIIKMHGTARFGRDLAAAAKRLGVLEDAETAAAQHVIGVARGRAPVDTGALRSSLQSDVGDMFSRLEYANVVHWGSKRSRSNPFLYDSARETEAVWIKYFEDVIDKAVNKIAD